MFYFVHNSGYFLDCMMDGKRGMNARLNSLPATSRKMSARLKDAHLSDTHLTGNSVGLGFPSPTSGKMAVRATAFTFSLFPSMTSGKMSTHLKDAHLSDIRLTGNSVNSSESGAGLNGMRSSENRTLKTKFIK